MSRTAKTIKTSDDRIIHITSMAYGATVSVREGGRFHERKLWIQPADDTDACGWVFLRGEFREVVYDSMGYKCIGERSADEYVPETVAWEIPETVEETVEEQVVETRTVWTVDETTGFTVQYGDRLEMRADWGNCTQTYGTEEEAVAAYYRDVYDALPRAWKRENDCSNGRFRMKGGLVAGKLERVVEEWDEDAEEWVWVDGEVLELDVWDGDMWVEF